LLYDDASDSNSNDDDDDDDDNDDDNKNPIAYGASSLGAIYTVYNQN